MPTPTRLYPEVIITHPPSEKYDEGYTRIFGQKPVGPLARALQREQEARQPEAPSTPKHNATKP